ncbi:hypothetical protein AAG596_08050 [Citromicrobium bathyomarinum]
MKKLAIISAERFAVRLFSDFRIFERPPKPSAALFRWIAWRWLVLGVLLSCFILAFAAAHFIWGQPIYYTNEDRNLTDAEVWQLVGLFAFGGALFSIFGLMALRFIPKG